MKLSLIVASAITISLIAQSCSQQKQEQKVSLQDASASVGKSASSQVMLAPPTIGAGQVFEGVSVGTPSSNKLIDMSWKDQSGKTVKLSELAKGKAVMINFWATWCGPCRKEIPDIIEIAKENSDKLVVVGVTLENPENESTIKNVSKFAIDKGINYPLIVGNSTFSAKSFAEAYASIGSIDFIPMTFIFNKDGMHVETIQGSTNKAGFANALKKVGI